MPGSPIKYILFCAQDCNFQTRSMLIPYDKIMQCDKRAQHIQILRDHSQHNVTFEQGSKKYVIDNLLIQNFTWNNGHGVGDFQPFSKIVHDFSEYAYGIDEGCLFEECDSSWVRDKIINVVAGFNHVANYCNFRNVTNYRGMDIDICEGFLVLESTNGEIRDLPDFETLDEFLEDYFDVS